MSNGVDSLGKIEEYSDERVRGLIDGEVKAIRSDRQDFGQQHCKLLFMLPWIQHHDS
jgi:hypothetical protein